jgi:ribosomal protein S17
VPNPKAYETPGEISLTNTWTSKIQKSMLKVLVEGKSDVRFYKKFIRPEKLYPVVDETNNNRKIKQTVKLEEERYRRGLTKQITLGIVDSDFDRLKSLATPSGNIFATDTHDLETMLMKSAAFEAVLRKFYATDTGCIERAAAILQRLNKADARSALLNHALAVGFVKLTICENSLCVDYGMITSKKDIDANVFQGNHFLLDSNIIFRLIGFNNAERKRLLEHFIQRCGEVNISLHYTNITFEEILRVLRNAVNYINRVNNGDKPLSPEDLEILGLSDHKDIYALYYNWSKNNPFNDYQAFGGYLEGILSECIGKFGRIDMYNYEMDPDTRPEFLKLAASLMEFKSQRKKYFISEEAVKTDVNNFLYLKHLPYEDAGHYFIISTDIGLPVPKSHI